MWIFTPENASLLSQRSQGHIIPRWQNYHSCIYLIVSQSHPVVKRETSIPLGSHINLYAVLGSWIVCITPLRSAQQEMSRLAGGYTQVLVCNDTFQFKHPTALPPESLQSKSANPEGVLVTWLEALWAWQTCIFTQLFLFSEYDN